MQSSDIDIEPVTDETLMLAYGRGDARAFETLYARHKGGTYRYFLRHTAGVAATAQELHQDLWLKVIAARERYEARAKFSTWLYTLARHRLTDHWRSSPDPALASLEEDGIAAEVEASIATRTASHSDDPLGASVAAEASRRLVDALAAVPPLQRDAFLLHIEGGLSLDEIAGLTRTSSETVKSRLRYAYRRLRAALEDLQ